MKNFYGISQVKSLTKKINKKWAALFTVQIITTINSNIRMVNMLSNFANCYDIQGKLQFTHIQTLLCSCDKKI